MDDEPQMACDVLIENEDGTVYVIGHAAVVLPMRSENG